MNLNKISNSVWLLFLSLTISYIKIRHPRLSTNTCLSRICGNKRRKTRCRSLSQKVPAEQQKVTRQVCPDLDIAPIGTIWIMNGAICMETTFPHSISLTFPLFIRRTGDIWATPNRRHQFWTHDTTSTVDIYTIPNRRCYYKLMMQPLRAKYYAHKRS